MVISENFGLLSLGLYNRYPDWININSTSNIVGLWAQGCGGCGKTLMGYHFTKMEWKRFRCE